MSTQAVNMLDWGEISCWSVEIEKSIMLWEMWWQKTSSFRMGLKLHEPCYGEHILRMLKFIHDWHEVWWRLKPAEFADRFSTTHQYCKRLESYTTSRCFPSQRLQGYKEQRRCECLCDEMNAWTNSKSCKVRPDDSRVWWTTWSIQFYVNIKECLAYDTGDSQLAFLLQTNTKMPSAVLSVPFPLISFIQSHAIYSVFQSSSQPAFFVLVIERSPCLQAFHAWHTLLVHLDNVMYPTRLQCFVGFPPQTPGFWGPAPPRKRLSLNCID